MLLCRLFFSSYLLPFFPGAILHGIHVASPISKSDGIEIQDSGIVSLKSNLSYGNFTSRGMVSYNHSSKTIVGNATFDVSLNASMDASTGDLNVCKIASNYLSQVHLLNGSIGDTGDIAAVYVDGHGATAFPAPFFWNITGDQSFFPSPSTNQLSITVFGQYNQVCCALSAFLFLFS